MCGACLYFFLTTGCRGGTKSPTGPSGPPAPGSTVVYSAVGASDVIGVGSSKPCLPFEDCNGNGYVWVAARQLRSQGYTVNVFSLGIPTAVISRTFQDLGNQNGRVIAGNLIDQEVPFIQKDATVVTVLTGANEVNAITAALGNGAGAADPGAYIDQMVSAFRNEYATVLAGITARAPSARVIVLNLPNLAGIPYLASASVQQRQAAQRASVGMTAAINGLSNTIVIDLMCDTRLYQPANYSSDGFHPNDSGYAIIGAAVAQAMTAAVYPPPKASCPQMTLF